MQHISVELLARAKFEEAAMTRSVLRQLQRFLRVANRNLALIQTLAVIAAIAIAIFFGVSNSDDMDELEMSVHDVVGAVEDAAGAVNTAASKITEAVDKLNGLVTKVNTSVKDATTAVGDVEGAVDMLNASVAEVDASVEDTTTAVQDVEGAVETLNASVEDTTTAVQDVEGAVETLNMSVGDTTATVRDVEGAVGTLNTSVGEVNTSVGGTTLAVETLDGSVATLARIIREIEDPKLRAGDLISVGPRRVGEEDRVFLVAEVNGTDVTLRWITTWDVLDQSGCEGRLIRLLTNREVSQLSITPGAHIRSPAGDCFASLY